MRDRFQGWEYDAVYKDCIAGSPNIQSVGSYQSYLRDIISIARQLPRKPEVIKLCEQVMNGALIRGESMGCKCEFCAAYDIRAGIYDRMSPIERGRY